MSIMFDPRTFPERPPSEVEWEDILLRVEIAPRALRVAIDDVAPGHPGLAPVLQTAVLGERILHLQFEALAAGEPSPETADIDGIGADPAVLADDFVRLRSRTFAMVQRRGLNVWEWRVRGGPFDGATSYQLLQSTAAADGAWLKAIRSMTGTP
ncbi:hypothetical protein HKM21_12730 [Longimicrobium terrae]|nr:hypothetical protein [Longimicrobium terrae]NNC30133.1 hypothetical protein [Longimicrobium terrae]